LKWLLENLKIKLWQLPILKQKLKRKRKNKELAPEASEIPQYMLKSWGFKYQHWHH
jgi:hypothetical protein